MAQTVKSPPANAGDAGDTGSVPGLEDSPWRREWLPTPIFLPGEFKGQRSLAGYSPRGRKESDTTERLTHMHSLIKAKVTRVLPRDASLLLR